MYKTQSDPSKNDGGNSTREIASNRSDNNNEHTKSHRHHHYHYHEAEEVTKFYREAQLNNQLYGELMQGRVIPIHFVISVFCIVGFSSLVYYHDTLSWELFGALFCASLGGYTSWIAILWLLGKYFIASKKCLDSWKYNKFKWKNVMKMKYFKKFLVSCRPLEFHTTPKLFPFRLTVVLKFMNFINWAVKNLLLLISFLQRA